MRSPSRTRVASSTDFLDTPTGSTPRRDAESKMVNTLDVVVALESFIASNSARAMTNSAAVLNSVSSAMSARKSRTGAHTLLGDCARRRAIHGARNARRMTSTAARALALAENTIFMCSNPRLVRSSTRWMSRSSPCQKYRSMTTLSTEAASLTSRNRASNASSSSARERCRSSAYVQSATDAGHVFSARVRSVALLALRANTRYSRQSSPTYGKRINARS
mmetsp:Transcript_3744/g.13497  ORF Transcript_3744/g.13497 Transcript_3744/m.13497 type:complete len:221 (+) Transcript_3744:647-1309(+)